MGSGSSTFEGLSDTPASYIGFGGKTVRVNSTENSLEFGSDDHQHANKVNLDNINQNLGTSESPGFAGLTVNGNILVSGTVDGLDVSAHAADVGIHHINATKTNLDTINQNLSAASSPAFAGLAINGNVSVAGTVNGVDVSTHADRHLAGEADALVGNLDANARIQVKANGTPVGIRRSINFIAGENVSLEVVENQEYDYYLYSMISGIIS